jgi:transcriptional regulator with XRE-family HTH domain
MCIGNNIKKLRELRNFTQTHISERLNMSLSGYSKIERDETEISVKKLEQIAAELQTDIRSILELDTDKVFNIQLKQADKGVQSGYVGSQKNFDSEIFERYIHQLKEENEFLRELIKRKE